MNLIERYVSEIGKHLPRKSRADIETEIRSTLEDMLEERSTQAARPVDDEMVKNLLREYGAPRKVAATYLPEQSLIGPKMFPFFLLVLKIVGAVLTGIAVIGFGIRLGVNSWNQAEIIRQVGKTALEYLGGLLSAFGNIVLVFAILERVLPKSEYENELDKDWTPEELTEDPDPDEVRTWEPIVASAFMLLGLIFFNFYPQGLGIYIFSDSADIFVPALSEAFFRLLPWINVTWMLAIGLNLWLLRNRHWTPAARWFEIGLKIAGIVIAAVWLNGPSLLALTVADLTRVSIEASAANILVSLLKQVVTVALAIAVIVGGFEVVREVYKLLFKKTVKLPIAQ